MIACNRAFAQKEHSPPPQKKFPVYFSFSLNSLVGTKYSNVETQNKKYYYTFLFLFTHFFILNQQCANAKIFSNVLVQHII